MIPKSPPSFRKILIPILMFVILFVFSGLGILAQPLPADALWNIDLITNEKIGWLLLTIWKLAIYPIIKDLVIKIATLDFSITGQDVFSWLFETLVFQTAEAVMLTYTGFSLCANIQVNFRLAMMRATAPDYQPWCTWDRSLIKKYWDFANRIYDSDSDEVWQVLKDEYFNTFSFEMRDANNVYGSWFSVKDNIETQLKKKQQNYVIELLGNNGFLGGRDCSQGIDANKNGKIDNPEECKLMSPGQYLANEVNLGAGKIAKDHTLGAAIWSDVLTLMSLFVDTAIGTALTGVIGAISQAANGYSEDYGNLETTTEYTQTGENQIIPIPQE